LQFQPQYFGDYLRAAPRPALKDLLFYWPRIRARTRLARRADYVVSMGGKMDALVEERLGVPAPRILHLPNAVAGVAAEPTRTGSGDPRLFLFVGKIEFRKGMTQLLQAFRALQDGGIRLRLVGDGPMASEIRRSRLSNIELVGQKFGAALRQEYQAAGAFLYPSLQEGMPTAIMEAMSHGRPVIATDVGATRLLVTPATGLLLAPHDSQAIVQAVKQMTTWDDAARRVMGQAGRQLIQTRYTWDRVAPRYIHSFVRAVDRAAPSTGPARPVPNGAGF